MAENSTLDNGTIDDLYLTNGISEKGLNILISTIIGSLNMMVLLNVIAALYICCKMDINVHVKKCSYCTDPTSTEMVCEQSKTKKVRFCRIIERWTAWLLVDLFRTPKVGKKMENNKVFIKVLKKRSLVVGEKVRESALLFICISYIFCLYSQNFLADFVLKLTPTCIDKGDFGIPAACYAMNISYHDFTATPQTSYQINCTTWNDNLESLGEEMGLLFCFSFYYNILTSVTELIGMFGLQTVVVQLTLIILEQYIKGVKRKCCMTILIIIIGFVGFIFITFIIPMLMEITNPMNKKRLSEVMDQQALPTFIALLSMALAMGLILITDKDGKTTEETHNTRECDEELLKLSTNHNTNPYSRHKGISSILSMTHGHQRNHFTEERMEEQTDGETDILLMEEGRNTRYDNENERSSKTTQREDVTIVEIHDYTTEETCTTREHNEEGPSEGYGNTQMEHMETVVAL